MPHKQTIGELALLFFSAPIETLKTICTILAGSIARWCLGGGKFSERLGDLIVCIMIFYFVRPWIHTLPEIAGVKIRPAVIAIAISLLGSHGIAQMFAYFFKKKTGVDLKLKK